MKINLISPILSFSGYGEQSRYIYSLLYEDHDVHCNVLNWGDTSWIFTRDQERKNIDFSIHKAIKGSGYDVTIQVCGPLEVKRYPGFNILYTAGIETDKCMEEWIEPLKFFDLILVPSQHAKDSISHSSILDKIQILPFSQKKIEPEQLELRFSTARNLLSVSTITARKNLEFLIKNFIQEFYNEEVGLILKLTGKGTSYLDFEMCKSYIQSFKHSLGAHKCKIYLLNGYLTEGQMRALLRRDDTRGYISPTHGEGFGLPLFEAATEGVLVGATDWSGHLDYLKDYPAYLPVEFEVKEVETPHQMMGYIKKGQSWAYPKSDSFRKVMREILYRDSDKKYTDLGEEFHFENNKQKLESILNEIE